MALNQQTIWIAAAVVAALVIILLLASAVRRSRSARLRDHFGSEYDHAVRTTGSRTRAEENLIARTEEAKAFDIHPLSAAEADRYRRDWAKVEQHFVERPTMALSEANELIDQIMRAQGYPIGDFERHAAHLSVKHPRVVEHYRAGHAAIEHHTPGETSTEDLRQAMLRYRKLIDELLGPADVATSVPVESEIAAERATAREPLRARTPLDRSPEDIAR
ncbi:MAG TPA: hypothetical protein VF980_18100 [Thermoanaerobaculia bacterium]